MEIDEAVDGAFESLRAGSKLVKLLLSAPLERKLILEKPVIVVFTGYGLKLAERARDVRREFSNAPIYVFGPDNLSAAKEAERAWDAVTYKSRILRLDKTERITHPVVADASQDTKTTLGQATVAARMIEEKGFQSALLVTAAYHQPRAYMTLLRSLIKRGIHSRVRLIPKPYCFRRSWNARDRNLKDAKSWASAFAKDELPRIIEYQRKGDVASWKELERHLGRLR